MWRFAAEPNATPEFKRVLAEAKPEDMVEFVSLAGLPARAVRTPWLEGLLFRGAGKLPFGSEIRPVRDLLQWLLGRGADSAAGVV